MLSAWPLRTWGVWLNPLKKRKFVMKFFFSDVK